jgi:hypothetical protein
MLLNFGILILLMQEPVFWIIFGIIVIEKIKEAME